MGCRAYESNPCVGVLDGWHSAIDVDVFKRRLLEITHVHELGLVWDLQLLENDGDLPWVGSGGYGIVS